MKSLKQYEDHDGTDGLSLLRHITTDSQRPHTAQGLKVLETTADDLRWVGGSVWKLRGGTRDYVTLDLYEEEG